MVIWFFVWKKQIPKTCDFIYVTSSNLNHPLFGTRIERMDHLDSLQKIELQGFSWQVLDQGGQIPRYMG